MYTKESLEDIINAIPMLVAVVDKEGEIFLANDIIKEFSSLPEDELEGQRAGNAFGCEFNDKHPSGCGYAKECNGCQLRNTITATIADGNVRKMLEIPFWFKGQGKKDLRITTKLINLNGQEKVLLSIEDLEPQKYETKLEQYKSNKKLINSVLHEMKDPLQIILGYIQLIQMRESKKEDFDKINNSIEEMKEILKKLEKS